MEQKILIVGAAVAVTAVTALYSYFQPTHYRIPKRLILLRHGESQGNVDHHVYENTADNQLHLTAKGWDQASAIGKLLKQLVGKESVRFFLSPYVRARETHAAVSEAFGGVQNMKASSSTRRVVRGEQSPRQPGEQYLKWTEDPRIREQDFGNYQDEAAMKQARIDRSTFSRFFYRFPNGGESAADVYDRVSLFFASLYRNWNRKKRHLANQNTVLVCHGITIQIFFMRWFKYNVDEFMTYDNPSNCEAAVFEREWDRATKNYKLVFKYILLPDGTHENVRRKRTDAILKREIDLSKPLVPRARSKTRRMSTILSEIQQQGLGDRTRSHHAMHPVN